MKTQTTFPTTTIKIGQALAKWTRRIRAKWARNRDIAQTWHAFRKLDNSILRDIGVDRSEIGNNAAFDRLMNRT